MVVRVVGQQFAWEVHYPGPDGKFGRTDVKLVSADNPLGLDRSDPDAKDDINSENQMHVQVNRPVLVHLSSKDVIHSFGLYEMRVKQDAVPGLQIPVWFIPTVTTAEMRARTGKADFDYEIACSQLCGLGHFRMRGFLVVDSADDYQKWMADQQKGSQQAVARRSRRSSSGVLLSSSRNWRVRRSSSWGSVSPFSTNASAAGSHDSL